MSDKDEGCSKASAEVSYKYSRQLVAIIDGKR